MSNFRVYDASSVAAFSRTKGPMGALSNFNPDFPIEIPTRDGVVRLDSTETWYQADKFRDRPDLQKSLVDAAWAHKNHPRGGKDFARMHNTDVSEDWVKGRSVKSMRYALRIKTAQHREAIISALADAKGRPIVEFSNKDEFWGAKPYPDGTLRGHNILGRLWMELAAELEKDPDAHKFSVPCYDTRLFGHEVTTWTRPARILNAHAVGTDKADAIYVGRPTKWGNPVKVDEDTPRGEALNGYLDFLKKNPAIIAAARTELAGRDLICWCAPRACHAGVLAHVAAGHPVPDTWPLPETKEEPETLQENAQGSFGF